MSFILDALNRSHAERQQQATPAPAQPRLDLLSQPPAGRSSARPAWLVPAIGGAAAALLVALAAAGWLARDDGSSLSVAAGTSPPAAEAAAVSAPASGSAPSTPDAAAAATETNAQAPAAAVEAVAGRSAPPPAINPVASSGAAAAIDAQARAEPPATNNTRSTPTLTRRARDLAPPDAAPRVPEWAQETGPDDDAEALLAAAGDPRGRGVATRRAGAGVSPSPPRGPPATGRPAARAAATPRTEAAPPADPEPPASRPAPRTATSAVADDDALAGVPRLSTLDPGFRESLPRYLINALMYSNEPAERLVILDLVRYREGDRTRDGATIARIARKGVVLDKSGKRFAVTTQ